jgi:hypothetical protein
LNDEFEGAFRPAFILRDSIIKVKKLMKKNEIQGYYSQSDKKWQSDSSREVCKKPIDSFYLTGISHFTHISKKIKMRSIGRQLCWLFLRM